MIFLIEYDRPTRRTLRFTTFDETERQKAQDLCLQIELDLNRQGLLLQHEIVLLQARDEQALRRTHGRYFENLPETPKPVLAATEQLQS